MSVMDTVLKQRGKSVEDRHVIQMNYKGFSVLRQVEGTMLYQEINLVSNKKGISLRVRVYCQFSTVACYLEITGSSHLRVVLWLVI